VIAKQAGIAYQPRQGCRARRQLSTACRQRPRRCHPPPVWLGWKQVACSGAAGLHRLHEKSSTRSGARSAPTSSKARKVWPKFPRGGPAMRGQGKPAGAKGRSVGTRAGRGGGQQVEYSVPSALPGPFHPSPWVGLQGVAAASSGKRVTTRSRWASFRSAAARRTRSRVRGNRAWPTHALALANRLTPRLGIGGSTVRSRAQGWPGRLGYLAVRSLHFRPIRSRAGPDAAGAPGPGQGAPLASDRAPSPPRSGGGDRSSRGRPFITFGWGDQAAAGAASTAAAGKAVAGKTADLASRSRSGQTQGGRGAHGGSGAAAPPRSQPAPTQRSPSSGRLSAAVSPSAPVPLFPNAASSFGQARTGARLQQRSKPLHFILPGANALGGGGPPPGVGAAPSWNCPNCNSYQHLLAGQQFEVRCGGRRRTGGRNLAASSPLPHALRLDRTVPSLNFGAQVVQTQQQELGTGTRPVPCRSTVLDRRRQLNVCWCARSAEQP